MKTNMEECGLVTFVPMPVEVSFNEHSSKQSGVVIQNAKRADWLWSPQSLVIFSVSH
ncbi:MAG: hypothetical protein LBU65_08615 [Planctomycetaceae bacterium]|jgi:hypothetical protein|nr:hypothetical protein [Planctomycetaceae bacterium]